MRAEVSATVTRGPESWQFFAFVFAAAAAFGLSLLEELPATAALRIGIKTGYFFFCFFVFLVSGRVRNRVLMPFLRWVKEEPHG